MLHGAQDSIPDALGAKELRARLMMDLDEPAQAQDIYRCACHYPPHPPHHHRRRAPPSSCLLRCSQPSAQTPCTPHVVPVCVSALPV